MAIQSHELPVPPELPNANEVASANNEYATVIELPAHISDYQVYGMERASLKDPEITPTGAHIYQELCSFYDSKGHKIVREATIAIPNDTIQEAIPYPVVATDPWTTGPQGLNRIKVRQLVDMGFPVVWLHHADQRSPLQLNKSVNRSARQMHALMDNLEGNSDFDTNEVIADGYSRGGMTGEKFIAQARQHDREVVFSVFDAPCFATDMTDQEKFATLVRQLPKEIAGIGSIAIRHFVHGIKQGDLSALPEFARTLNLHPKNILHEVMWAHALVNANVGPIIDHQPKGIKGIRNFFEADEMSQLATYVDLYSHHPNVVVVAHDGPHVEGASPQYLYEVRRAQFSRLGQAILNGEVLDAEKIAQRSELDVRKLTVAS